MRTPFLMGLISLALVSGCKKKDWPQTHEWIGLSYDQLGEYTDGNYDFASDCNVIGEDEGYVCGKAGTSRMEAWEFNEEGYIDSYVIQHIVYGFPGQADEVRQSIADSLSQNAYAERRYSQPGIPEAFSTPLPCFVKDDHYVLMGPDIKEQGPSLAGPFAPTMFKVAYMVSQNKNTCYMANMN